MSLNLLLQSIATSSQTIIRNVNSYDFKLQRVPSQLSGRSVTPSQWFPCLHAEVTFGSTGFMKSYDRISSAFTPERLPVDGGRNTSTCIAYSSQSNHAHCAAVQAFVVDVSVIGSVGVFTLLVVPFLTSALHSSFFISATLAVSWHDFHSW